MEALDPTHTARPMGGSEVLKTDPWGPSAQSTDDVGVGSRAR
jgi:hypothetical protein